MVYRQFDLSQLNQKRLLQRSSDFMSQTEFYNFFKVRLTYFKLEYGKKKLLCTVLVQFLTLAESRQKRLKFLSQKPNNLNLKVKRFFIRYPLIDHIDIEEMLHVLK